MSSAAKPAAASPFFLDGPHGGRYCLFHPPAGSVPLRGSLLYIHPFGEEMNCSRHIAAVQARQLAARGYGVLQLDLTGCGDSCGELRDATWAIWIEDIGHALAWLTTHCSSRFSLWGHRVGALLALDAIGRLGLRPDHVMLWQPVINGRSFLTNFLRLALAGRMTSPNCASDSVSFVNTNAMRDALANGSTLEIGGYDLSGTLASAFDHADATQMTLSAGRIHWIDIAAEGWSMSPAAQRLIDRWRGTGLSVDAEVVDGAAFWSIPGHGDAPALAAATMRMMESASS